MVATVVILFLNASFDLDGFPEILKIAKIINNHNCGCKSDLGNNSPRTPNVKTFFHIY